MINETFARQIYPGDNPIGRQFILNLGNDKPHEIIGVVGDVKLVDARRRDSADGVPVVAPVCVRPHDVRGPHHRRSGATRPGGGARDPRDRSAAAGVGGAAARGSVRGIDRAAAADRGGDEHVCRARRCCSPRLASTASSRIRCRSVRASSAFASRSARGPAQIVGMVVGQNLRIVALGLGAGPADGDSGDAPAARIAVPGGAERSDHVRRDRRHARGGRDRGVVPARAPRARRSIRS